MNTTELSQAKLNWAVQEIMTSTVFGPDLLSDFADIEADALRRIQAGDEDVSPEHADLIANVVGHVASEIEACVASVFHALADMESETSLASVSEADE